MRLLISNSFLAWGIGIFFLASANCAADEGYRYNSLPSVTYISEDKFGIYMNDYEEAEEILESRYYGEIRYIRTESYEKYALYNSDFGIIFDTDGQIDQHLLEFSVPHSPRFEITWLQPRASSALVEGEKIYKWDRNARTFLDNPWAEGVEGDGVGEYLEWKMGILNFNYLVFVNGFVSIRNPDLYWYNNRIKELDIVYPSGDRQRVVLEDTMLPQLVVLDTELNSRNFDTTNSTELMCRIEIVSTYPGSRWDDTCLAAIFAGHAF